MGLYLYCVGPAGTPAPDGLEGVDGHAVDCLDLAGLRLWVSDMGPAEPATVERVRAHAGVVEAASARITPLPMRYGQWFETESALRAALEDRREELARSLAQVRDALEFGVRVVDPEARRDAPPDGTSGRAYLEALARREREAAKARERGQRVAEALGAFLGGLVRAQRVRDGGADTLVAIDHLVARHDTGNYRRRIEEFPEREAGLRFFFTGPWPPYGFVDEEA